MKKVFFIISLLALAACDNFPHSGGVGPPRPDRSTQDGSLPPDQATPATPAPPAAK